MKKFDMSDKQANFLSSVVYIISGVASPLFGFTIDKIGRNIGWILSATIFTALAHILMGFTQLNPYFGMVQHVFQHYIYFLIIPGMCFRLSWVWHIPH